MKSEIRVFSYRNGEIQRVQVAWPEHWEDLELLKPVPAKVALDRFADIYRLYLIPAAPWLFGQLVMFRLPEEIVIPLPEQIADPYAAASLILRRGVTVRAGKPRFRDSQAADLWNVLEQRDCIRIVPGKQPWTTFIPVGNEAGFLTESAPEARLKINSAFFIMDPFDCSTPYDHVGAPFGLFVKDGIVARPPLYNRESFLVKKDDSVSIRQLDITDLTVRIGDQRFVHGRNARFYTRPGFRKTPAGRQALVITGGQVAAVCKGHTWIPCSGFVICPVEPCPISAGTPVVYEGLEDVRFGIQVGNSILKDGVKTDHFISRFYNIKALQPTPYPPSLYPLNFNKARAARIALGADAEGRPMLLWAEGAAKLGHTPGIDSCGASLKDMARLCEAVGMKNAVNLDGGGSAQMLLHGKRNLMLSDRRQEDFSESERPVPLGLYIR